MTKNVDVIRTASTLPQFFQNVAYTCIISSSFAATLVSIWKLYAEDKYRRSLTSRESITKAFRDRHSTLLTILLSYYNNDRLTKDLDRDDPEKGTPLLLNSLSESLDSLSRSVHELPGATPMTSTKSSSLLSEDVHELLQDLIKRTNRAKQEIMPAGRSPVDNLPSHVESAVDLRTEIRSLKGLLLNRRSLAVRSPSPP